MDHIGRLKVGDTTVASRNGVCNIIRFCGATGTTSVGPIVNYRVCITPGSQFSHRADRNRSQCCRLVLLTRGGANCTGLVGVISVKFARKCCCQPHISFRALRGCRRKLVYLSTYLTKRIPHCVIHKFCRRTGNVTGGCRSYFKGSGCFLRLRSRNVPSRGAIGRKLLQVDRRLSVPLIYAGSVRCACRASIRTRSILLYVRANGGVASRSHVHCRNKRFFMGDRRRVQDLFPCTGRTTSGARGVTSHYRIALRFNGCRVPGCTPPRNCSDT